MAKKLIERIAAHFGYIPTDPPKSLPKPVRNSQEHLEGLWEKRSAQTKRSLGNAGAALRSLDEYETLFQSELTFTNFTSSGRKYSRDTACLRDRLKKMHTETIVGDPDQVSRLFGGQLSIGYSIESDEASGLSREHIEEYGRSLTILRQHGQIVSAYPSTIIRMESKGGITII